MGQLLLLEDMDWVGGNHGFLDKLFPQNYPDLLLPLKKIGNNIDVYPP